MQILSVHKSGSKSWDVRRDKKIGEIIFNALIEEYVFIGDSRRPLDMQEVLHLAMLLCEFNTTNYHEG